MGSLGKRRAEPEGDHLNGRFLEHHDLEAYVGGRAPEGTVEGLVVNVDVSVDRPDTLIADLGIGGNSRLVRASFIGKDFSELRSFLKAGSVIQMSINGAWIVQIESKSGNNLLAKFIDSGTTVSSGGSSIKWDPNEPPSKRRKPDSNSNVPQRDGAQGVQESSSSRVSDRSPTSSPARCSPHSVANMSQSVLSGRSIADVVQLPIGEQKVRLMGVVHSVRAPKTSSAADCDFEQTVTLLDPSNLNDFGGSSFPDGPGAEAGLVVVMFGGGTPPPKPSRGDILVLDGATVDKFHDKMQIVCHKDSYRFTCYPHSQEGHWDAIPTSNLVISEDDRAKLQTLAGWWKGVLEERRKQGLQELGKGASGKQTRAHSLIRDAPFGESPDYKYFNCTVEIVQVRDAPVERSRKGRVSIFVTDYTTRDGLRPIPESETWCPARLRDRVLEIDLFLDEKGNARKWASDEVKCGQFWSILNLRLKTYKRDVGIEASLKEYEKATLLDHGKDHDRNTHYRELLQRRDEFRTAQQ